MPYQETLLSNTDGSIVADGPLVLICDCQGAALDLGVRVVTGFALVLSAIISTLVALRAVPWPILIVTALWVTGALVALAIILRRRRLHGEVRIDFERGEITQQGRGFRRRWPTSAIAAVSTPVVAGPEGAVDVEPGHEPRWLLLHLQGGARLRLAKGPGYALRPAVAFLKKEGVEVRRPPAGAPGR